MYNHCVGSTGKQKGTDNLSFDSKGGVELDGSTRAVALKVEKQISDALMLDLSEVP